MLRGKFSIDEMLSTPEASAEPEAEARLPEPVKPIAAVEDSEFLPAAGDPYKAHARQSHKPEPTLHLLLRDGTYRGFSWGNYDSIDLLPGAEPGDGPVLVLRFAGIMAREVLITGRNLSKLHVYLGQQRIAWVRELPAKRGFADPQAAVITGLLVRPVEEKE